MNLQDCPDKATLFAYANGELPSGSNTEVSRHVERCTQCRTIVESINLSELATLGPQSELEAVKSPAESPQSMRFIPDENKQRLSDEMRALTETFSDCVARGQAADIAQLIFKNGAAAGPIDWSAAQIRLLLELICIELRHAWSMAPAITDTMTSDAIVAKPYTVGFPTTDQYVQRFPILRACPLLVADLAKAEASIRGFLMKDRPVTQSSDQPSGIDEFELIEPIASGGMGVVWKAKNRQLGRIVAVKLIQQNKSVGSPEREQLYQQRFLIEAQAAARLTHPNIVPIHSIHNTAGQLYYEMDLIEGGSLRDFIKSVTSIPVRRIAEVMLAVADAIDHAHRRGVIHRDLKPENILMQDGKIPMVTDFGLAKLVDSDTALTQDDTAMGTMNYMAPEQFRDAASVTVAADIYSLGTMLYELISGRVPIAYAGDIASFTRNVQEVDPIPPQRNDRAVSRDIQNICLKCLMKQPEQRYASAGAFAADLQAFLDGRPVSARRIGPFGHFWRLCQRHPRTAGLAGALVLALVVGFVVSIKFMFDAQQQAVLALEAVNHFYLQIDQNDAFRQPAFNDLRVRLMQEGRDRLDELTYAPVTTRDQSSQRAIATLHFINGRSLQEAEQSDAAFEELQRAKEIQNRLSVSDALDLDSRADLATTLVAMEQVRPKDQHAQTWLDDAQLIREAVVRELPDDDPRKPKSLRLLANVFMNNANRLAEPIIQRHVSPAPESVREAQRLFRVANEKRQQASALAEVLPVDAGERDALARDIIVGKANLAVLLSRVDSKSQEAMEALNDAADALSFYLSSHAWDVEARRQFAECQLSKYLMAAVKDEAAFAAIEDAERDASIVLAMNPGDMPTRRTVARIALERALELIVDDLETAIEQNANSFNPANLNAAAVNQLNRAFEYLPRESELSGTASRMIDSEFIAAVRLARTLRILTPLEGVSSAENVAADENRKSYLVHVQTARQGLYGTTPEETPIDNAAFQESRIWILAYSTVVAHLQFETARRTRLASQCLEAIKGRRQAGQDSSALDQCEAIATKMLQLDERSPDQNP